MFALAAIVVFAAAPEPAPSPRAETCLEMRGGIYEVRPDGTPGAPADAPQRPYLILANEGPSVWVNAEGLTMPMTWTCVPDQLSFTVASNTTVARRKDDRYELNEKPLVRFVPKPENAARCDALPGLRWEISNASRRPALRGAKLGRGAFQSDLGSDGDGPEEPALTFDAKGKTLEHWDGRIRREKVPYACDASGVTFATGGRLEHLTWTSAGGIAWFDRVLIAPK